MRDAFYTLVRKKRLFYGLGLITYLKWLAFSKGLKNLLPIGNDNIQLPPEGEVNSGGYIPRREASRYISTALHRP